MRIDCGEMILMSGSIFDKQWKRSIWEENLFLSILLISRVFLQKFKETKKKEETFIKEKGKEEIENTSKVY